MTAKLLLAASALALSFTASAYGAGNPLDRILECARITNDAERLSCFDTQAGELSGQVERGDLVAVDRDDMRRAERDSFGLPSFSFDGLFSGVRGRSGSRSPGALAEAAAAAEPESEVREVRDDRGGISALENLAVSNVEHSWDQKLVITLANGQVWRQTDSRFIPVPRRGREVSASIQRASVGSYFMQLSHSNARFRAARD